MINPANRCLVVLLLLSAACAHPPGLQGAGNEFQASVRTHDLLDRPDRTGPFPAVIMLHGCSGLGGRDRMWAERIQGWGHLVLRVNSFASHGGAAALSTLSAAAEDPSDGFRAAIAIYPGYRRVPPWRTKTPPLILLGELDDWTDPGPCQALAGRQRQAGSDVTQVTYPGAYHNFATRSSGRKSVASRTPAAGKAPLRNTTPRPPRTA